MSSKKVFTTGEAKKIGEILGLDWGRFDVEQFRMGMDVELEHGSVDSHTNVTNNDPLTTGKIALAKGAWAYVEKPYIIDKIKMMLKKQDPLGAESR